MSGILILMHIKLISVSLEMIGTFYGESSEIASGSNAV